MTKNLKANRLLPLAAVCLLGTMLTSEAAAQGAYTNGQAGQLKASEVRKLKALHAAPIAVPTYVPAGYKLKHVSSRADDIGDFWSIEYGLIYKNAKGDSFYIDSANEGIGDALIIPVLKGKNPFFEYPIFVGPPDLTAQGKEGREREVGSQWVNSKPAYAPAGAPSATQHYRLGGKGLSKRDALKVMLSLRYLK